MIRPSAVIILAAGEGARMRSSTPKVLHSIAGRSLLGHVIEAAATLEPEHLVVVVGHGREQVIEHIAEIAPWALIVVQAEQLGTGHAVRVALADLDGGDTVFSEAPVVVLTGDTPLLSGSTLVQLVVAHAEAKAAATVLTARVEDPYGYGRIIRDAAGGVQRIVEHKDALADELVVDEINSGMYAFDLGQLRGVLGALTSDNAQGEQYLPDVVGLLRAKSAAVAATMCTDASEIMGVNDRVQLARAAATMRDRINTKWMRDGVSIADPSTTWVDVDVDIAPDVTILPGTTLRGPTSIATGARIGPGTTLVSCEVAEDATVIHTWAELAVIGARSQVGPFTYLRPGTVLGADTKAGAFVEIKNTTVGDSSKVPHLSYVGDAQIGTGSNIGAATVFVNYDGVEKHRTVIGDHVRVGSDTMLVAPVTIGDGAYTAAGSVITEDVPPGAIGVGRARQRNILDWVRRRRPGTPSAQAASAAGIQAGTQAVTQAQEDK